MILKRKVMNLADMAELENAKAAAIRNADLIEYIAMMTDVEIPTDEEVNADEE